MTNRPDSLCSGELARLIPVVADTSKEQRSASILLAGMRSVFELRQALLKSIGVRVGSAANSKRGPKSALRRRSAIRLGK